MGCAVGFQPTEACSSHAVRSNFAVLGYWQSETLPTFKNGFDSHVPLQFNGLVTQPGLRCSPVTGEYAGSNPAETANYEFERVHEQVHETPLAI